MKNYKKNISCLLILFTVVLVAMVLTSIIYGYTAIIKYGTFNIGTFIASTALSLISIVALPLVLKEVKMILELLLKQIKPKTREELNKQN